VRKAKTIYAKAVGTDNGDNMISVCSCRKGSEKISKAKTCGCENKTISLQRKINN